MTCFIEYWNPLLTLFLSFATLAVVAWYTYITSHIERAAQNQAEASQKPVIVFKNIPRSDRQDQIMERLAQEHVPQAGRLAVTIDGFFIIKNIGTGPALNLTFDFAPIGSANPKDPNRYIRRFPYVAPADDFESPVSPSSVLAQDYEFSAHYESLSGKRYLTEMILHARAVGTVVLRDDWIFKEVDPPNLFRRIKARRRSPANLKDHRGST